MIGILGGMGTNAGLDFCNKLAKLNIGKTDQNYPLFILYNKSNIPIDVIISPELEVAKSLYRRLEAPGALDSVPFGKGKVKMLEISIEKNCPIKNIPLKKLTEKFPDFKANILGALRKEKFIYLKKNDQMLENDNVYLVVSSDQLNPILKAFGHEEKIAKNVLIIGVKGRTSYRFDTNACETCMADIVTVNPGDALYIPKGMYHEASPKSPRAIFSYRVDAKT